MTRGERNNNPGNLRNSDEVFQGEVGSTDSDFKQFQTAEWGIRALAVILRTYYLKHGLDTIRGVIMRYAPGSENDTEAYIADVSNRSGFGADDVINGVDPGVLTKLVSAIIFHENGENPYTMAEIDAAIELT